MTCSMISLAQEYVPWPDSASIWVNTVSNVVWSPMQPTPSIVLNDVNYFCMSGADTVISANTYKQIHYCGESYKGALREVDQTIYFVPRDSVNEYLLYDFDVQPGDTLYDVYVGTSFHEDFSLVDMVVNNIDTQVTHGSMRPVVYLNGGTWISGIGNHQGLFMEPWPNVSDYLLELHCFSHLDSIYYPWTTGVVFGTCAMNVGIETSPEAAMIQVYPNPTTSTITLQTETPLKQAWLTDLAGRRLMPMLPIGTQWEADLSTLPSGMYLIDVLTQEGKKGVSKVVRE